MPKILAIDDNNDNLISLRAIIDDTFPDAVVFTALNGQKGIELALANNPDVILLDVIMPGMDGFEVCRLLKLDEQLLDIPVVFLTALKGDIEDRFKALEVGAEGFLSKPIDKTELTAQIRAMFKIKAANEQKRTEKERLKKLVEERTETLQNELNERRFTDKSLKESEEKYRIMVELLPDAVIIHQNGKFVFANRAALKTVGANSFEQFIERPLMDYVHPDFRTISLNRIKEIYSTGQPSTFSEEKIITLNDEIIDVEVLGIPILYMGKPAIQTIIRDITERKQTEESMRTTKKLLEQTFEQSPVPMVLVSMPDGMIRIVNPACLSFLGIEDEPSAINKRLADLKPTWQDFDLTGKTGNVEELPLAKSLIGKKTENEERYLIRKDGTIRYELVNSFPIIGNEGEIIAGHLIMMDITERKLAENALQESEAQFREFFEKAADAIFIADIESGIIVDANHMASSLMLKSHDQLVGMHQSELHPPVTENYAKETFTIHTEQVKQKVNSNTVENTVLRADGTEVPVEILASEVDYHGKSCMMGTFRDITERKKAEELLRESEYFFKESQRAAFVGSYKFDLIADYWTSSEVLEQIFGIDKSYNRTLEGWLEIIHPDDREMMRRFFGEEVIGKRQPFNKEYRIIRQSEVELRWVLGVGKLNFDAEGNIIEMIGTIQDITERKLAEEKLHEINQRFSELVSSTDGIIWEAEAETFTFSFISKNVERILGYRAEQWLEPNFWANHIYEDDRNNTVQFCEDQTNQGYDHNFEYRFICQDGRIVWLADFVKFIKEPDKSPSLHGLMVDITERKEAEVQQRESQQLFQGLFNASPDAIVLIDPHHPGISWPILDCNQASCKMNGYTREEMIGQSIDILNIKEGTPEERIEYIMNLRQKGVIHGEFNHRNKDGHIFPVETSTSLVSIGGREMVLGIDRDITERKLAEEAIRVSEVRLKRAELASKSGNWEFYLDSQTMVTSEGAEKIYGLEGEKPQYDIIRNVPLPEYRPMLDASMKNLIENDTPYDVEFKIQTIDTHEIKDIHSVAFFNKEKRVMFGIIQDVSGKKQAEEELIKSQDRYRRFISQISEGVYRFECDVPMDVNLPLEEQIDFIYDHMFIAECNYAFQRMYGLLDEKEVLGKSHLDFHGGRNNPLNRSSLREFVINGYRVEGVMTEEINPGNGQLTYFSNNSLGIIEKNQLVRIWGTQADITEKMRADQVQQVLYTISNAAISTTDLVELVEIISIQLSELLDTSNLFIAFYDEASGMLSTLFNKDEIDEIDSWPAEKSATGYVIKNQKSLLADKTDMMKLCEKGEIEMIGHPSEIWLGVPLVLGKKAIGAIVVQSYDNPNAYTEKDQLMLEFISDQICISLERKKAEQEVKDALSKAQESDRLKSAFLANMSHEIRTPLNSIIGFSELLLDKDFGAEQHEEFARTINSSGSSLLTIISDIMDFSKIEAGQIQVNKKKFSVNKLINGIQKEYSYQSTEKGIVLRIDPTNPEDEIFIESDEQRIRQVLINFISNAIKFTEKGFVEIGFGIESDRDKAYLVSTMRFFVKDSGIGISEEYHQQIFERFRQVETSNTRKYGGNGLGLAISKNLVELLGGQIGMESEKGKGSTFYFTIPHQFDSI